MLGKSLMPWIRQPLDGAPLSQGYLFEKCYSFLMATNSEWEKKWGQQSWRNCSLKYVKENNHSCAEILQAENIWQEGYSRFSLEKTCRNLHKNLIPNSNSMKWMSCIQILSILASSWRLKSNYFTTNEHQV